MTAPEAMALLFVDPTERGTRTVRVALDRARDRAAEQGVLYRDDATPPTPKRGARLVIDARADLADLDPAGSVGATAGLGPDQVRVLISAHGLARALIRDWQEAVIGGRSEPLDDWLRSTMADAGSEDAGRWLGHRQRELVERWIECLGPDRVSIVVPCIDHLDLLRALEGLAGLEAGSLGDADERRALTLGETEAIRALNSVLDSAGGKQQPRLSRVGSVAAARMATRTPDAGEAAVTLPPAAAGQIRDEASALAATIAQAGVTVIGNLACLSEGTAQAAGATDEPDLPPEAAALLTLGIIDWLRLGREGGRPYIETRELATVPASRLLAEIAMRPVRALGGVLHGDRGRGSVATTPVASARVATAPVATIEGAPVAASAPTLPPGTRLLHIGPSKTGTTALQGALDRARETSLQQGVRYIGWRRHARAAVLEATGKPSGESGRASREWRAIVEELRTARESRAIFSAEELAHGDSAFVRRLVDEIGPSDVHVAVTLRPLARILPSTWQEVVKAAPATTFEPWLRKVLAGPEAAPRFWRSHRHDELINRWAAIVGPDRVTAIVVGDRDQSSLPNAFESLLGLRPGTLRLHRDRSNRSLTLGEVEAVRLLNSRLEQQGFDWELRRVIVALGASYRMRQRDPDRGEARVQLPSWAEDPVGQIARDIVDGIGGSGVRVIGDLGTLAVVGPPRSSGLNDPARVPPAAASAMAIGVLEAARLVTPADPTAEAGADHEDGDWLDTKLAAMPARDLMRTVGGRARHWAATFAPGAVGRRFPPVRR